jgi:cell wall-associated NlpC family hydrolase
VRDAPFALVKSERTFLRAAPLEETEVVNEALRGEPVYLLDLSADRQQHLCHSIDGYVGWVHAADVETVSREQFTSTINAAENRKSKEVEIAIADANERLGKPYIWGGRSDDGVDCSGLVQRAYAAAGVHLPRDAEQQALCGKLVATRNYRDALRRGDILFFLGRRGFVAHTGIYLGEGKYIESADGSVRISKFNDDTDRNPREDSFCFAKRILD